MHDDLFVRLALDHGFWPRTPRTLDGVARPFPAINGVPPVLLWQGARRPRAARGYDRFLLHPRLDYTMLSRRPCASQSARGARLPRALGMRRAVTYSG